MEYVPMTPENIDKLKEQLPPSKPDYLTLMAEAIRDYEGKPGDRNYINNNPGNLRGGQWSLAIGFDDKRFCIFKTMEDGMFTLRVMLTNCALGKSQVYKPTDSLVNFFSKYAPSSDNNNPQSYATFIGKRMAVNPFTWQIKNLLS